MAYIPIKAVHWIRNLKFVVAVINWLGNLDFVGDLFYWFNLPKIKTIPNYFVPFNSKQKHSWLSVTLNKIYHLQNWKEVICVMLPNQMKHCTSTVISNIVQKYENNCTYLVALKNGRGDLYPLFETEYFCGWWR